MARIPSTDDKALPRMAWFFRVDLNKLRAAFINGKDLYSFIVTERMGDTSEQEMRMFRRAVKELSYGLMYRAGIKTLKRIAIEEVVAEVSLKKAEEMYCAYLAAFPEAGDFLKRVKEEDKNDGESKRNYFS